MLSNRKKFYSFFTIICVSGYVWLFLNLDGHLNEKTDNFSFCFIKHITNIPCPSCGATRSTISILHGDLLQGLYLNPFGYLLFLIMIVLPVWICYDYLFKNNSLMLFYSKAERFLKSRKVAIPAILLILANWVWNIYKGL